MSTSLQITRRAAILSTAASCAISAALAWSVPARAAETGQGQEASTSIEELVVTARRREEALERVPVTVSVITADAIAKRSISSQADLQTAVPGLIVRSTQGSSQFNYAIRGQSVDAFSASQPGVLTYVNEFQTTALSSGSFYDLGAVQVLKGPQGTLFGRNTTGGAVLYSTAKPEFDGFSGLVKARLGDFDLRGGEAMVNVPINDMFALRLAGTIEKRDGFVRNLVNGENLNNVDRRSARLSLRFRPTDQFESTFVGEINRSKGNGDPLLLYTAYGPGQVGPDGRPLPSLLATFYSPILDTLAGPGAFDALRALYPQTPAGGYLASVDIQRARGTRATALDAPTGLNAKSQYLINTTTYDVSDALQVKNIVGYAKNQNFSDFDQDGSPFPFYGFVHTVNRSKAWSEELQISGKLADGNLNYIAGVYYSDEDKTNGQDFQYFDLGPVANPILAPAFGATSLPLANQLFGRTRIKSFGGFVQGTYKLDAILQGLSATGGFRYTEEKTNFTELSGFAPVFPANVEEDRRDSKPSWTLGLEYQATEAWFFYATSRGSWRGGGYNYNAPPVNRLAEQGGNTFGPEKIKDVEVGAKFKGRLAGAPSRLSIALYKQWVDDVQRIAYVSIPAFGPAGVTVNVPGAEFKGVDIDGGISPTRWLQLGGSFSYTDAKYTSTAGNDLFGTFFQFSTFADIAKTSGSVYAEVDVPLEGNLGSLSLRADAYAQSSLYFSNYGKSGAPGTRIPAYELVNLRASLHDIAGSSVSAAVFAKNVFDKEYYVGGIGLGTQSGGYNMVVPGEPRMIGAELSVRF